MGSRTKPVLFMLIVTGVILILFLIMQPLQVLKYREYIGVLFPSGSIAVQERNLLFIIQAVMLLIVFPVYILTFVFSWKYRASNPKAVYDPDLEDSVLAEYIWWGLPLILTIAVCTLTWIRTHELDPFKSIAHDKKEKVIQVVALQWRWLFIYPDEKIATINFLQIPVETPIRFQITADAPMNSFWIPNLGGQIYAMPNMKTELNLIANEEGDFRGSSANISGKGFARMNFITRASSQVDYDKWVESLKQSKQSLDYELFNQLAKPSEEYEVKTFQLKDEKLFNQVLNKYMHPNIE